MEPYYFHRFRNYNLERLIQVLESGFILPRSMMKNPPTDQNNIFNGTNWISLAQKTLMDDQQCNYFRSSYNELIPGNICVVISPSIDGIVFPDYFDYENVFDDKEREKVFFNDGKERFSYYLDEVQTDVPIPTSKFIAIGYPVSHFKITKSDKEIAEDIENIKSTMERNKINIPILDSTSYSFADDERHMKTSKILELKR